MDSIPFEKVSISQAKAVLDEDDSRAEREKKWEHLRRLADPSDLKLKQSTYNWLLTLPREIWPLRLVKQFPRIANHLAEVWMRRSVCASLLAELLLDERGTRKGFPEPVTREIMVLKSQFETEVAVATVVQPSTPTDKVDNS